MALGLLLYGNYSKKMGIVHWLIFRFQRTQWDYIKGQLPRSHSWGHGGWIRCIMYTDMIASQET